MLHEDVVCRRPQQSALYVEMNISPYLIRLSLTLSSLCTTSGTSQLHGANHSFLSVEELQVLEVQFANLDGLTETQVRNVNNQSLRDEVIESFHFKLTDLQSQLTTGFYTFSQTFQLYGYLHNDGLSLVDFVEVNVQNVVFYGVELDILHDGVYLLAIDDEVNHVDVGGVNKVAQTLSGYSEMYNLFATIEYARYAVVLTNSFQSSSLLR